MPIRGSEIGAVAPGPYLKNRVKEALRLAVADLDLSRAGRNEVVPHIRLKGGWAGGAAIARIGEPDLQGAVAVGQPVVHGYPTTVQGRARTGNAWAQQWRAVIRLQKTEQSEIARASPQLTVDEGAAGDGNRVRAVVVGRARGLGEGGDGEKGLQEGGRREEDCRG